MDAWGKFRPPDNFHRLEHHRVDFELPRSDGRSPHGRATDRMLSLAHVVIATNAYEELLKNVNEMINVSNAVVRDMNELMR